MPRVSVIIPLFNKAPFIGRAPSRFVWTAIAGADSYSIGVWNEVDQIIWRQDHIAGTSVDRPEDVPLDPGTYRMVLRVWAYRRLGTALVRYGEPFTVAPAPPPAG